MAYQIHNLKLYVEGSSFSICPFDKLNVLDSSAPKINKGSTITDVRRDQRIYIIITSVLI